MSKDAASPFYQFRSDIDVHVIDCSGYIDLETGLARLLVLQHELDARPPSNGVSRLLIDFRNTVWHDETVHMELSKTTRTRLLHPDNSAIRAAIVNTRVRGQVSDNEHWFSREDEALDWLSETKR